MLQKPRKYLKQYCRRCSYYTFSQCIAILIRTHIMEENHKTLSIKSNCNLMMLYYAAINVRLTVPINQTCL